MIQKQIGISLLGATVLFSVFSCKPRDVSMLPNRSGNSASVNAKTSKDNEYKMTIHAVERQVEALHLVKAILNTDYMNQKSLAINDENGIPVLRSKKKFIETKNNDFINRIGTNYEIINVSFNENGSLRSLILKNTQLDTVRDSVELRENGKKKVDINFEPINKMIAVYQASNQTNEYTIQITRVDKTNTKANGATNLTLNTTSIIEWSGQAEDLDKDIKISSIQTYLKRDLSDKVAQISDFKITNSSLLVSLKDTCASANGSFAITKMIATKPEATQEEVAVQSKDSSFDIHDVGYTTLAQPCEIRPIVDLSRLL